MSEYRWLNEYSQQFLERDYLVPGQTVDERVDVICQTAEGILEIEGFAERFKKCVQNGWVSLSTPIWANFGTDRGLPISCFGSHVSDSVDGIMETLAEVGMMTKYGGGTSAYFGDLRPRGAPIRGNGESFGSVHFMQLFDSLISVVSQGKLRRGSLAAYLPIWHKDIEEFLTVRTEGSPLQDISTGITVPDQWMNEMVEGDVEKRRLWAKVLQSRISTGYPYIVFTDTANNCSVDVYKDQSQHIQHSNLCSEIMLPDGPDESFVCDLSSMNILYYDEWKDTDCVELLTFFLDAVMTEFITKAKNIPYMGRAVRFAERHRALGIGWLGWHSYLQSKMIPFESMEAKLANSEIAKLIQSKAYSASAVLAGMFGEPDVLKGYGRRNTTLTAIAPTKSSAFILEQVSEGIEPHRANYYIKDLAKGKFTIKNQQLQAVLQSYGKDIEEVWLSILQNSGSVQHLDWLSENERAVFKTFIEISPKEVIIQAAQRQRHIDQSQSLNLMIDPNVPVKDLNALIIEAWRLGVKSLYYQFSVNAAQQLSRSILTCSSCEA